MVGPKIRVSRQTVNTHIFLFDLTLHMGVILLKLYYLHLKHPLCRSEIIDHLQVTNEQDLVIYGIDKKLAFIFKLSGIPPIPKFQFKSISNC